MHFIAHNLEYPEIARRRGWEGRVLLIIKVDESGVVHPVRIVNSSGYTILDRSAERLISNLTVDNIGRAFSLLIPVDYVLGN